MTTVSPKHVVADGAVAHGVGAAGARGAHATDGALAARVDGEEQALVAQMGVQLLPGDARPAPGNPCPARSPAAPPFMRARSRLMPPRTGVTCPSSDVPAPNGTTGTRWACDRGRAGERLPRSVSMKATPSGMTGVTVSSPWLCCSRRAALVVMRSPRNSRARGHDGVDRSGHSVSSPDPRRLNLVVSPRQMARDLAKRSATPCMLRRIRGWGSATERLRSLPKVSL